MKRIAFWLYQVYAWLIFIPLGLLLTFVCGWLTVLMAMVWNPRAAEPLHSGQLGQTSLLVDTGAGHR